MLVYSKKGKISDILGNPKDKFEQLEKSEIKCDGCNAVYIGQTRRSVSVRFGKLFRHIRFDITIQIYQMSPVMSSNLSEILIVNTKSASTTCLLSKKYEKLNNWMRLRVFTSCNVRKKMLNSSAKETLKQQPLRKIVV
jgi:hypothetical protein